MSKFAMLDSGALALAGAAALTMVLSPAMAASKWSSAQHSAVRLLDGGRGLAGIEIRLDPGFITYWRDPGEAGVPPRFDFSRSINVAKAEVLYPAPRRLDEDGTIAYGYADGVTLPVRITPIDPAAPVRVEVGIDYAVCSRLCLPAEAHVTLSLEETATDRGSVLAAMAEVPKPARLHAPDPIAVDSVAWTDPGTIAVEAAAPDTTATLFVEAPDPWYFAVSASRVVGPNRLEFVLTGPDRRPPGSLPSLPLRLTLVAPSGSVEVSLPLDAIAPAP